MDFLPGGQHQQGFRISLGLSAILYSYVFFLCCHPRLSLVVVEYISGWTNDLMGRIAEFSFWWPADRIHRGGFIEHDARAMFHALMRRERVTDSPALLPRRSHLARSRVITPAALASTRNNKPLVNSRSAV